MTITFGNWFEANGKVVGGLIWFPRESPTLGWAEILDMWINKNYQRRGLGFRLITEAIHDMKSYFRAFGHKAKCVILFTSENNVLDRSLYEKAGFKKVGYGGHIADDGTRELRSL